MPKTPSILPAYQQALGLLVRREHSRRELKHKLARRGHESGEIEAALETLSRQDFQNDVRFAQAMARSRLAAGYGPVRIRAELVQHGLDGGLVEQAIADLGCDWPAQAAELAARRFRQKIPVDPSMRRKAAGFLLRRGFDTGIAYAAVRLLGHDGLAENLSDDPE